MNIVVNGHKVLEIIIITFLISLILVPLSKKIANHVGAMDMPNKRKVHDKPMPRLGGLAIYASFLIGYIFYGEITTQMLSILISTFIIVLLGLIDDISPVRARYKFLVQILCASIIVIYGQIYFSELSILGYNFCFNEFWSYFLSIFFIVSITNAINLIDGLDGLAAGVSSIYFLTISIIAIVLNRIGGLDIILSIIMLGSTLGFLIHNFPPAKVFMGDIGSTFLGFMIAVISLLGFKITTLTSLVIPILILALPILDTVFAIIRRLLKGKNIGAPDKEHFHHQLLKLKFSPKISILIIYAISILFSAISILYVLGNNKQAMFIYVIISIMLLFIILKTNILFDYKHKFKKKK